MPFVTTLLITLWFSPRDSAQARQSPASGSHPLPSRLGQLILRLLGAAEDMLPRQVFWVLINSQTPMKVIIIVPLVPVLLYRSEEPGGHGGGHRAGGRVHLHGTGRHHHIQGRGGKARAGIKEVGDTKDKVVGVARERGEKARNKKMGKAGEKRKEGSLEKLLPSETLPYSCNAWWGCLEKSHFWTG